jgi:hypothetical protein
MIDTKQTRGRANRKPFPDRGDHRLTEIGGSAFCLMIRSLLVRKIPIIAVASHFQVGRMWWPLGGADVVALAR